MDKMIKHANERLAEHGINVFYSTPSCYIKALHDEGVRLGSNILILGHGDGGGGRGIFPGGGEGAQNLKITKTA